MRVCISFFTVLWCFVGQSFVEAGSYKDLLEAQFFNVTEDIQVGAADQHINAEDVDIVESNQPKWYTQYYSFDQEDAESYWKKLKNGYELLIQDPLDPDNDQSPLEHVFKAIKLKFDFDFYGQTVRDIVITSSGAIITGSKDNDIELPNHIAPFLSNLPPSDDDEVVYINDDDQFVIQWIKYVDGNADHRLEFQAKLHPEGKIEFIYHNIQFEAKKAAANTGYPVIIGLQNQFVEKNADTSKETVHTYPSVLIPLEKLFVAPYSVVTFTPTPNRCHRRAKEFCNKKCVFCEDTNVCVNRIETFRSNSPCIKGETQCPDECSQEEDAVCGTDGVTYHNQCLLTHAACIQNTDIQVDKKGQCDAQVDEENDENTNDEGDNSSDDFDRTNDDEDDAGTTDEEEEILRDSNEDNGSTEGEDECNCENILTPYCLNGNKLFNNLCLLDCTVKKDEIEVKSKKQGQCGEENKGQTDEDEEENSAEDKCAKTCNVDKNYDVPVCGSDGEMYPNECKFDLAVCKDTSLKVLGDGTCQGAEDDSEKDTVTDMPCPSICTKMYQPVCGTDGKTYSNKCLLDLAACEQGIRIGRADTLSCEDKLIHNAEELGEIALKKADLLAEKNGKFKYHMGVSRAFRLSITLGVALAVVSTIALIVVLIRHQRAIRRATREMAFQRMAANHFGNQYADEPREVEMNVVQSNGNGVVKYDKLPLVP